MAMRLPSYDNPPVIEVVIGAQFHAERPLQIPHIGLFWQEIRDNYSKVETAAPLMPISELPEPQVAPPQQRIDLLAASTIPRTFFIDESDSWLIQIQPDRFLQNWRKRELPYPRFEDVLGRFSTNWERFHLFCERENLGVLTVNQLEVTYINHIFRGEGWESLADLSAIFKDLTWSSRDRFLPGPELVNWRTSFAMPDKQGRLHVTVRSAARRIDAIPVLLCEMTARGLPLGGESEAIFDWIRLAREWIVLGFEDIMADTIQDTVWGRQR